MANEKVIIELDLILNKGSVRKTTADIPKKFGGAGVASGNAFSKGFSIGLGKVKGSVSSALGGLKSQFIAFGAVVAAGFSFKAAINGAAEMENSFKGLASVSAAFGSDLDLLKEKAKEFSADGVIPLAEVTTSFKTLLANFNGDAKKTVDVFLALRDAAAFNRQGTLSLGEAIVGASEGLKNDLSIKVDNAGITKNLSILQKEYAESIGKTVGKLTAAEKVQAEYVGILKEGSIFQGDYNKSLDTFSGSLDKVSGSFKFLLAELGKFATQSSTVRSILDGLSSGFNGIRIRLRQFREETKTDEIKTITAEIERLGEVVATSKQQIEASKGGRIFESYFGKRGKLEEDIEDSLGKIQMFQERLAELTGADEETTRPSIIPPLTSPEAQEEVDTTLDMFNSLQAGFDNTAKTMANTSKKLASTIKGALVKGIVGGVQNIVNSLMNGENAFKNFGKFVLGMMGEMATQIGTVLIGAGLGVEALKVTGGGAAIAAGIGLVAVGAVISNLAGGGGATGGGSFSDGGGSTLVSDTGVIDEDEPELKEEKLGVTVNITGDILDSNETGSRIVQLINDSVDGEGVTIRRNAIA